LHFSLVLNVILCIQCAFIFLLLKNSFSEKCD